MSGEALRDAICDGELAEAKRLVEEEGMSVNYVDADDGWPLLLWAVKENQPACLAYLIKQGANLHMGDASGNTALHKAAYLGDRECLDTLLAHGAMSNARNRMNQTPMELADLFGQNDVMEVLATQAQQGPQAE